jgi:hypothetical protein
MVYSDGRKGMRAQGSYALNSAANTTATSSFVGYDNVLTPLQVAVFGARLTALSELYQLYKINNITLQWVPTIGTDYPGNVLANISDGVDVASQWFPGITYQEVSQRDKVQPASVKQGFNISAKGKGDWLYINNTVGSRSQILRKHDYGCNILQCCSRHCASDDFRTFLHHI